MGKPTGFIEFVVKCLPKPPLVRIGHWKEFSALRRKTNYRARLPMYGLRHSVLPHRVTDQRHGRWLPGQQPDSGME